MIYSSVAPHPSRSGSGLRTACEGLGSSLKEYERARRLLKNRKKSLYARCYARKRAEILWGTLFFLQFLYRSAHGLADLLTIHVTKCRAGLLRKLCGDSRGLSHGLTGKLHADR